jgi:multidrug efflux system outer membrane protein
MLRRSSAAALLAATALAGCTMAPTYHRPGLPVAQSWPTAAPAQANGSQAATPVATELAWKDVFLDPKLQAVIELSLAQNRDLRVAVADIERARAEYRVQRAELLPAIGATLSGDQTRTPAAFSPTGQTATIKEYQASVGFSAYELDLFGRIRSLNAAALQSYFATAETRRAVQISLIAEVAGDYLTLAADQDALEVTRDTLKTRDQALDLGRKQFDAGSISQLDLRQQETLAEQARSDLAVATAQVAQDLDALRLVVGAEVPADLLPHGDLVAIRIQRDLQPGLPSEVLTRRPDVLSAEHTLQAQNANIGAARAAFFPRISLTGATGSASTALSGLFTAGTGAWNFAPQIALPLFSGGANIANLAGAKASRDIAVAQYEKAVQTAFREVADALAVRSTSRDRLAAQEKLVVAADDTVRLTQARYDRGVDSYLALLVAQRTLYASRLTLLSAQLTDAVNRVELYKALGGGAPPDKL